MWGFDPEKLYQRGVRLYHQTKYNEALECFEELLSLKPSFPRAWFHMGMIYYLDLGKHEEGLRYISEAIKSCDKLIQINPKDIRSWVTKSDCYMLMSKWDQALECLEKAKEIDPSNPKVIEGEGIILQKMGRFEDARKHFEEVAKQDGKNISTLRAKSELMQSEISRLMKTNSELVKPRLKSALEFLEEAIRLYPDDVQFLQQKAIYLSTLSEFKEALDCIERAIQLAPYLSGLWALKGIYLSQMGSYIQALSCYEKAITLDSTNSGAIIQRGIILYAMGAYTEALECFNRAAELMPEGLDLNENEKKIKQFLDGNRGQERQKSLGNLKEEQNFKEFVLRQLKVIQNLVLETQTLWPTIVLAFQCKKCDDVNVYTMSFDVEELRSLIKSKEIKEIVANKSLSCKKCALEMENLGFVKFSIVDEYLAKTLVKKERTHLGESLLLVFKNTEDYKDILITELIKSKKEIIGFKEPSFPGISVEDLLRSLDFKLDPSMKLIRIELIKRITIFFDIMDSKEDIKNKQSKDADEFATKAVSFLRQRRDQEALMAINNAVNCNPADPKMHMVKGEILCSLGRYEEGLKSFENVLKYNQNFPGIWANLAFALEDLGQYERAIGCIEEILRRDPKDLAAWIGKCRYYYETGKLNDALDCSERVLKKSPLNLSALRIKGLSLRKLDRQTEAFNCFMEIVRIDPVNEEALFKLGVIAEDLGNLNDALNYYNRVLKIIPRSPSTLGNKGNVLNKLGLIEEALKHYDMALQLDENRPNEWFNKGSTLLKLWRFEEAPECFDKCIQLSQNRTLKHLSWIHKAESLLYSGKEELALRSIEEAITLNPNSPVAWNLKGILLSKVTRNYDEALKCFDRALQINPKSAIVLENKADLLNALEKSDLALKCHMRLAELKVSGKGEVEGEFDYGFNPKAGDNRLISQIGFNLPKIRLDISKKDAQEEPEAEIVDLDFDDEEENNY